MALIVAREREARDREAAGIGIAVARSGHTAASSAEDHGRKLGTAAVAAAAKQA